MKQQQTSDWLAADEVEGVLHAAAVIEDAAEGSVAEAALASP